MPTLSQEDVTSFNTDGYLHIRYLFSTEEIAQLRATIINDNVMESQVMKMKDAEGKAARLSLWHFIQSDTIYGAFAASTRLVSRVKDLFGGVEPYHIHTKVILKEPHTGGAFDIHQDFGYWYDCGPLDPNVMMSVIIAVDDADVDNGCLHVLKGSHKLGRIDHGSSGQQAGANPEMIAQAKARLPTVACELKAGDVLCTHSNLVHWSKANVSDRWRRAMIVAYNGVNNPPFEKCTDLIPMPHRLIEVNDDAILKIGPVGFKQGSEKAASFLSEKKNVDTFGTNKNYSGASAATA